MNFSGSLNFNVTCVGNNSIIDVSLLFFFNVLVLCLIARNFACYALRERKIDRERGREKKKEKAYLIPLEISFAMTIGPRKINFIHNESPVTHISSTGIVLNDVRAAQKHCLISPQLELY